MQKIMGSLSLVNKDGWVSSVWVHVGLSIFYVLLWWETINCQTCLHLVLLKVYSCYSCVHPWLYVLTFVEVVELNMDILNPFPTNNNLYSTIPAIKQDTNNIPLRNNPNNFQVNDGKEEFNKERWAIWGPLCLAENLSCLPKNWWVIYQGR